MPKKAKKTLLLADDPQWYKDAVIYELHVRAFADSNGDGIGDFRGLASRLDYLQDLGVTAIWLLPFYPSPLRDDGYDIADYTSVHPNYGVLADFKHFLREAHRLGLRVITELVVNHTSDQHPWFQRARRAPAGSRERDFYVWSDTPNKYKDARIIFKDFEASNWTWDPVAKAYFWHRFYSHQPDLNYANPAVRRAVFRVMEMWFDMGVDGLRLDAVPYLYEREGTDCENLPETHEALKELRRRVDRKFKGRMLLAEANQWPEYAVAYFGEGDECHMAFHFPVMPRMFMALRMEDRYPLIDILEQTPAIPENCQWALFLRNHDELTLEMVTDEERDYMYRMYAHDPQARINLGIRRRLAPLLGNDRRRIELMNGLLFSLPGTPVLYYGDEIGMGDNIYLGDRNGVRTPMQWSPDRNAGFSRANPQKLYLPAIIDPDYHYETLNVESHQNNPNSLLWWMRRLIALRRRYAAFGRGTLEFLFPENRRVLAFIRRYQDETLLVVANLSRVSQYVELDLSKYKGMVPVEIFGQTDFPPIGDLTYLLTLNPYAFYWFTLERRPVAEAETTEPPEEVQIPTLTVAAGWEDLFEEEQKGALERLLPKHLSKRRWFGGKARRIKGAEIVDAIPVAYDSAKAYVAVVRVDYSEGDPEEYVIPLTVAAGDRAEQILRDIPHVVLAQVVSDTGEKWILCGAMQERAFCQALLKSIASRRRFKGVQGEIVGAPARAFRKLRGPSSLPLETSRLRGEQSNTSVLFGDRLILKLFRRLDEGVNPDLEIGSFLTEIGFPHIPPVAGALEYRLPGRQTMTLAALQAYVTNEGDAWRFTLDSLGRYYERLLAQQIPQEQLSFPQQSLLSLTEEQIPALVQEHVGSYLESARLLGQRTADLHVALASNTSNPAFAPEPLTPFYQRSLYQSMRNLADQVFDLLRQRQRYLPAAARPLAERVLGLEKSVLARLRVLTQRKISGLRTRVHGDFHLGQVLWTGKDFMIIDFEGEPAHSLSARRLKRSPLRDVAGMLRSFDYAAYGALDQQVRSGVIRADNLAGPEAWGALWTAWVSSAYLRAYLKGAARGAFLPTEREELGLLLETFLLEKAIYEVGYELNNRPDWVALPLRGIARILSEPAE